MESQEALAHAKRIADAVMTLDPGLIESLVSGNPHVLAPFLREWHGKDAEDVSMRATYEIRYRWIEKAQKRALPLLRRFLSPYQRARLRKHSTFPVIGSAGGRYVLAPHYTAIERTIPRGPKGMNRRVLTYCYHDPEGIMCYADNMLGTMFLLMTDEPAFLKEANARVDRRYAHDPEVQALMSLHEPALGAPDL